MSLWKQSIFVSVWSTAYVWGWCSVPIAFPHRASARLCFYTRESQHTPNRSEVLREWTVKNAHASYILHALKTGHNSFPPQYLRLFKPRSTRCPLTMKGTLWDLWSGAPVICLCFHTGVSRPSKALPPQFSCHLSLPNYQRYSKRWQQPMPALQPSTAGTTKSRFYHWALTYTILSNTLFSTWHNCTTAYKHNLPFTADKPHKPSRSWEVPQIQHYGRFLEGVHAFILFSY